MADKYVEGPPAGPDAWRELWTEDRRFRPAPSKLEPLLRFVRRLNRRAAAADDERQKNFNLAVLEIFVDIRREMDEIRRVMAMRVDIESLQEDIRKADASIAADLAATAARIPVASMRNDALVAALDRKIETIAVRLRDITTPMLAAQTGADEDFLYRRLEDGLRGSEAQVREAVAPYVALAADHQPLFDAGCGRGELLLACHDAGIAASGCDTNERSVADLQQRGLTVRIASIPGCFRDIGAGSLGSIAALHVVEHLPVGALFELFAEAARTLRSDGLLMIETPNAESLFAAGSEFWRDPTHLAPRHPAALVLLGREHGFDVAEALAVHEFPPGTSISVHESDPPALQRVVAAINQRLFGPQDLRLILRKRSMSS